MARVLWVVTLMLSAGVGAQERAIVGPADFVPVLTPAPGQSRVHVNAFRLDRVPVTNAQFLAFVREHPEWRRDRVASVFADTEYLSHWTAPDALGEGVGPEQPVTRVSWFAARAYCKASGARLPDWYEWELAAAAPDRYGVHNLNDAIWEWVEDFNSLMVSGDSRTQGDPDKLRFCGAGALSAQDRENYPTLMRIAFLSALEARSTERSLGFRCAVQPVKEAVSARHADSGLGLPGDSLFRLDITLETADGHTVPLSALRGKALLLTLFYSECSSVCPMTTAQLQTLVHKLSASARKNLTVLMVSLDAARDTPETLTKFMQQHHIQGPRWVVARASASDVRMLAAALGVSYRELPDHTFNHSTVITLADPDGVIQARAEGWRTVDENFLERLRATVRPSG